MRVSLVVYKFGFIFVYSIIIVNVFYISYHFFCCSYYALLPLFLGLTFSLAFY